MSEISKQTSRKDLGASIELRGSKGSVKGSIRDRSRSGSQSKKPFMISEQRSVLANSGNGPLKNVLLNKSVSPTSSQGLAASL